MIRIAPITSEGARFHRVNQKVRSIFAAIREQLPFKKRASFSLLTIAVRGTLDKFPHPQIRNKPCSGSCKVCLMVCKDRDRRFPDNTMCQNILKALYED